MPAKKNFLFTEDDLPVEEVEVILAAQKPKGYPRRGQQPGEINPNTNEPNPIKLPVPDDNPEPGEPGPDVPDDPNDPTLPPDPRDPDVPDRKAPPPPPLDPNKHVENPDVPDRNAPPPDEQDEEDTRDLPDEPDVPLRPIDQDTAALARAVRQDPVAITGEIMPRHVSYESRINIVDAWQYPGSLRDAPNWVDKNWAGFGDFDPMRAIEPGPCLRVPIHGQIVLARIGDYVCRQEVKLNPELSDIRIEVWEQGQFEKLFLPVTEGPRQSGAPANN